MGEKKTVVSTISVERNPNLPTPNAFFASGFRIIADAQSNGLIELLLQPGVGPFPILCVVLDLFSFRDNKTNFTRYLAELQDTADDSSMNEKIPYSSAAIFSNMVQCSHSSNRTETLFGLTMSYDVANVRRKVEPGKVYQVTFQTVAAVYGTIGFQKKLISEILRST